ncbi:MAG: QueT transporter [Firmicutes bacterium ADurb.Bin182]|nr:MAG: QueT transporter [Firmicutes bacterium ADurb.Bin182]
MKHPGEYANITLMNAKKLAQGALIAAIYALLTFAVLPLSSGLIQMRVSEALSVLPWFIPAAVPGLFVGCVAANIIAGAAVYDIVFGSLATLLAAYITRFLSKRGFSRWLAPLPAVLINAVVVGFILYYVYEMKELGISLSLCILYVAIGQTLACYGLGMPLLLLIEKFGRKLF